MLNYLFGTIYCSLFRVYKDTISSPVTRTSRFLTPINARNLFGISLHNDTTFIISIPIASVSGCWEINVTVLSGAPNQYVMSHRGKKGYRIWEKRLAISTPRKLRRKSTYLYILNKFALRHFSIMKHFQISIIINIPKTN